MNVKKTLLQLIMFIIISLAGYAQSVGIGTSSPSSTLDVNGSFSIKISSITSNTTLDDSYAFVLCNNTASITVTLPTAIGIAGRMYQIKKINAGAVTIVPTSGQTIDGINTASLSTSNAVVQLVSNGSNWYMLNSIMPHYVGEVYGGGIVFYVDGSGQHGLISATTDQSLSAGWGCIGTSIPGAQGTAPGMGQANTSAIVAGCPTAGIAARICDNLILNGYSDWFLPTKDELNLMYTILNLNGLGNFHVGGEYWSSTESDANAAWTQAFRTHAAPGGRQATRPKNYPEMIITRAIRAF